MRSLKNTFIINAAASLLLIATALVTVGQSQSEYQVPGEWMHYRKQMGLPALKGILMDDLLQLAEECIMRKIQASCNMERVLRRVTSKSTNKTTNRHDTMEDTSKLTPDLKCLNYCTYKWGRCTGVCSYMEDMSSCAEKCDREESDCRKKCR